MYGNFGKPRDFMDANWKKSIKDAIKRMCSCNNLESPNWVFEKGFKFVCMYTKYHPKNGHPCASKIVKEKQATALLKKIKNQCLLVYSIYFQEQ